MKRFLLIMCFVLPLSGCSLIQIQPTADKVAATLEQIEPTIAAMEGMGLELSPETVAKGEVISSKTAKVAGAVQSVATIGATIPGPQQPFLAGFAVIAGAIGTVAGAISAFFQRRRAKKAETGMDVIVRSIETLPEKENLAVLDTIRDERTVAETPNLKAAVAEAKARAL